MFCYFVAKKKSKYDIIFSINMHDAILYGWWINLDSLFIGLLKLFLKKYDKNPLIITYKKDFHSKKNYEFKFHIRLPLQELVSKTTYRSTISNIITISSLLLKINIFCLV